MRDTEHFGDQLSSACASLLLLLLLWSLVVTGSLDAKSIKIINIHSTILQLETNKPHIFCSSHIMPT